MKNNIHTYESGSTLLLAIIILAGVMGVSLAIGALTTRELNTTSGQVKSTNALYAADAGMERGIFEFRVNNQTSGSFTSTLSNGAKYTTVISKDIQSKASLHQDQVRQFDFIGNYVEEVSLAWGIPQDTTYNVTGIPPHMHYSLFSFPEGANVEGKDIEVREGLCDVACGQSGLKIKIDASNPGKDHLLRIKPLYNGADFEMAITHGTGTLEVVKITSTGEFGLTKRALEADIAPGTSASGIWDYVLFSGSDL